MTDVLEYEIDNCGLGTTISLLSLFFHTNKSIILHAPTNYKILREVKSVFDIPDEKLTVITQESIPNSITNRPEHFVSDYCKFWSPYFFADTVTVLEKKYITGKKDKPCIGIVTNNGWWANEFPSNGVPFHRYYPKDVWLKIIDLILSSGYDIISLNGIAQTLEEKTYLVNELCDAVIGTEGGICHLAHLLKVPCIIMPWHHHEDGSDPHPDGSLLYVPHKMHLDRRTYFVKSVEEISSWDSDILRKTIRNLYSEQGNNVFINNKLHVNTRHLSVNTGTSANQAQLTEWETNFVKTYISNPTVGGF